MPIHPDHPQPYNTCHSHIKRCRTSTSKGSRQSAAKAAETVAQSNGVTSTSDTCRSMQSSENAWHSATAHYLELDKHVREPDKRRQHRVALRMDIDSPLQELKNIASTGTAALRWHKVCLSSSCFLLLLLLPNSFFFFLLPSSSSSSSPL